MYYIIPWFLTSLLYIPIFTQLYSLRWQMIDYTHAYFILPVTLWLVWRKRKFLTPDSSSSFLKTILYLLLLILSLLLYLLGWRQDYLFITTFSMIPVCFGLVLFFYGKRTARELLFPILYLLLLIPPPLGILDSITLPMRYGVTFAADIILKIFDIPVVRDGLLLSLGGNEIYMGEPCSGLRSLVTMFALGLVYAYLLPLNLKNKITLIIAIIPLALVGNLIRIVLTCATIYVWGPKIEEGPVHFLTGLVIFIIMIACFINLEKRLEENEPDT
ncbi:MAG: exosortase/archaeosortase family protein [Candidatus Omnitrophica bacterium]|nr:exosortase/archaeosortase family protein [Candidatus Omnitrophota bacterium]